MNSFYKFILTTFLILVLVVSMLAVVAFGFYEIYLKPKPANFEFSKSVSTITAIEIVEVKKVSDNKFEFNPIASIDDDESFLSDFRELKCNKGISVQAIMGFSEFDNIQAIKITYADKTFEVITPYGNINSEIFNPDFTIETLLNQNYFMFDKAAFDGLINKYSAK